MSKYQEVLICTSYVIVLHTLWGEMYSGVPMGAWWGGGGGGGLIGHDLEISYNKLSIDSSKHLIKLCKYLTTVTMHA